MVSARCVQNTTPSQRISAFSFCFIWLWCAIWNIAVQIVKIFNISFPFWASAFYNWIDINLSGRTEEILLTNTIINSNYKYLNIRLDAMLEQLRCVSTIIAVLKFLLWSHLWGENYNAYNCDEDELKRSLTHKLIPRTAFGVCLQSFQSNWTLCRVYGLRCRLNITSVEIALLSKVFCSFAQNRDTHLRALAILPIDSYTQQSPDCPSIKNKVYRLGKKQTIDFENTSYCRQEKC